MVTGRMESLARRNEEKIQKDERCEVCERNTHFKILEFEI